MFFNLFKSKKSKTLNSNTSSTTNNSGTNADERTSQSSTASKILHEYENSRFSPLNIDLNKVELNQKSNSNNLNILTGRAKKSNIPIYTGNPFNPYF